MREQDTIRLLRECDAGTKMGVTSIDEVLPYVTDETFKQQLNACKNDHASLENDIQKQLDAHRDDGKEPSPVAKSMSWMKTNMKLTLDNSDQTIADLMTEGCNMGVKSLNRYLNQYPQADEQAKTCAKRLIDMEDKLVHDIRAYL